jgi:hypothetical protein
VGYKHQQNELYFQLKSLIIVSRMLARVIQKSVRATQPAFAARSFASGTLSIPTDVEQQSGRRKEEMEAQAAGQVGFNRDPIVPAADAGTRANPIMVRTRF